MRTAINSILTVFIVGAAVFVGYQYKGTIFPLTPCSQPILYSLGQFDTKFGLSKAQFLNDIAAATGVWDKAEGGKPLFQYSETGPVTVNLIYDYRQQATEKMQSLGVSMKDDANTYQAVKAKYDSLNAAFVTAKAQVASLKAMYDANKKAYDDEVAYWNARGGAPKPQYDAIQSDQAKLNVEAAAINSAIAHLNDLVDSVNSAASVLNRLASTLNMTVKTYNSIGSSTGPEFEEGEYVEDASGKRLNIYQFSDNDMLVRVLSHEFGHALGLDHVTDPKAIMYRLNQSSNGKPTAADLAELARVCGQQK